MTKENWEKEQKVRDETWIEARKYGYNEALAEVEKIIDELEPDDMIKKGVTDYGISAKRLKTEIKALQTRKGEA